MPHRRPRLQVRDPNRGPAVITPQAGPVDTFEAPAITPPTPPEFQALPDAPEPIRPPNPNTALSGLAQGLSTLVPVVEQYSRRYQSSVQARNIAVQEAEVEQSEARVEAGAALYRRTRVSAADAVRRGILPAGDNPFLLEGYRRAELRTAGMVAGQTLQTSWASSDVRNSDDPEDYQDFITEFTQNVLAQFGPEYTESDILSGFIPEYDRALNVVQQQHTAHRVQANEQRAIQASGSLMTTLLGAHAQQPIDPDSPEAARARITTAASLSQVAAEVRGTGIHGRRLNQLLTQSIVSQAEALNRVDLLNVANDIRTGTGVLSGIPEHAATLQAARVRIENLERSRETYERGRLEREREELSDRLLGRYYTEVFATGGEPTEAALGMRDMALRLGQGEGGDPELPVRMNRLQQLLARQEVAVNEDPVDVALLQSQLADPTTRNGYDLLIDATLQGRINGATSRSLGQFYASRTSAANRSVFASTVYQQNEREVVRVVSGADRFSFGSTAGQIRAGQARSIYGGRISRLLEERPELATSTEPGSEFELEALRILHEVLADPAFRVRPQDLPGFVPPELPPAPEPEPDTSIIDSIREFFGGTTTPAPEPEGEITRQPSEGVTQNALSSVERATTFAELLSIQAEAVNAAGGEAAFNASPLRAALEARWDAIAALSQSQ